MSLTFYTPINAAGAILAAAHLVGDGHLVLDDASLFAAANPSPSAPVRVCAGSVVFKVIGVSGTTLTLDGTAEDTTDTPLPIGTPVECRVVAGDIKDLQNVVVDLNSTGATIGKEVVDGTGKLVLYVDDDGNLANTSGFQFDPTTGLSVPIVIGTPTIDHGIQGGTPESPTPQMLMKHQPCDPAFGRWELSSIGSFFEGIWDPILQFGYNPNQNDADPGRNDESSLYYALEANYFEPPTAKYTAEGYVQYNPPRDAAVQYQRRPWMFTLDKETGSTRYSIEVGPPQTNFGYFQVVGGIGTGGSFQLMSIVTGETAATGMTRIFTPLEVSGDAYFNNDVVVNQGFSAAGSVFDAYIGTSSYGGAYRLNISTTARSGSRHIILGRNIQGSDTFDYITSGDSSTGYAGIEYQQNGDIRVYAAGGVTTAGGAVTPSSRLTIFASTGWIGVNEGSPGGQTQITTSSTTTKGLIVKGVPSQSANLLEIQNSAGTAMSYFDSVGRFVGPANQYKAFQIPGNGSLASTKDIAYIASLATDGVPLAIQGFTGGGQTANLTEWRNAGFGTVATMSPTGGLTASAGAVLKAAGTNAKVLDVMSTTGQVAGNSADIRFFVPAAGVVTPASENDWLGKISVISSPGSLNGTMAFFVNFPNQVLGEAMRIYSYEGRVGIANTNPLAQLHLSSYSTNTTTAIFQARGLTATITNVSLTSNVATITTSAAHNFHIGDSVTLSGLTTTALNGTFTIDKIPPVGTPTQFSFSKTNADIASVADSGTATASQTANLTEWRDSSGAVMCYMSAGGSLVMKGGVSTNNITFDNGVNSWQWYRPGTDPLLYLRDNTNARMHVTYTGGASANAAITNVASLVGVNEASPGAQLQVTTAATTRKGLIVKGIVSQAANLIEAQDSTGAGLFSVDQNGSTTVVTKSGGYALTVQNTNNNTAVLRLKGASNDWAFRAQANSSDNLWIRNDTTSFNVFTATPDGLIGLGTTPDTNTQCIVRNTNNNKNALIVRSVVTGNATVTNVSLTSNVATITTAAGHVYTVGSTVTISGLTTTALNGSYTVTSVPTSTTFTFAKTNADIASITDSGTVTISQVANVQEWQTGVGVRLAVISPTGQLNVGNNTLLGDADYGIEVAYSANSSIGVTGTGNPAFKAYSSTNSVKAKVQAIGSSSLVFVGSETNHQVSIGTNNVARINVTAAGLAGFNMAPSGAQVHITPTTTTTVGLAVKALSSLTANLFEAQNTSGTALTFIRPDGSIGLPTLTDSAAVDNSLYYSSDQSKLVYKTGGVANPLY